LQSDSASIRLSTEHKGRNRREPVWIGRYRVAGKDSANVLVYRRYKRTQERAGVRPLRFHDLRHSFGTMAVRAFPITDLQTWMGHADITTTRKYTHYAPQPEAAARLGALVGEQLAVATELRQAL
jgi:integrase